MNSWWKYTIVVVLIILTILSINLFRRGTTSSESPDTTSHQATSHTMLTLTSPSFAMNQPIPSKYTCDGENTNPPFSISGVPDSARSLAIIMYDPDIPASVKASYGITEFNHWVAFNMLSTASSIEEGKDGPGTLGNNGAGKKGYTGPCPPDTEHRYFFELYALDKMLPLKVGATRAEVEQAMVGHIVEKAELIGTYNKISNR